VDPAPWFRDVASSRLAVDFQRAAVNLCKSLGHAAQKLFAAFLDGDSMRHTLTLMLGSREGAAATCTGPAKEESDDRLSSLAQLHKRLQQHIPNSIWLESLQADYPCEAVVHAKDIVRACNARQEFDSQMHALRKRGPAAVKDAKSLAALHAAAASFKQQASTVPKELPGASALWQQAAMAGSELLDAVAKNMSRLAEETFLPLLADIGDKVVESLREQLPSAKLLELTQTRSSKQLWKQWQLLTNLDSFVLGIVRSFTLDSKAGNFMVSGTVGDAKRAIAINLAVHAALHETESREAEVAKAKACISRMRVKLPPALEELLATAVKNKH